MKILLYGHNGWIGGLIKKELLKNNMKFLEGHARVDDLNSVETEILTNNITHIISTTGRTSGMYNNTHYTTIDYLENKGKIEENVRDNLVGPITLANVCKKYNIHLTYLGTGCIFNYNDTHPLGNELTGYSESDTPNFFGSSYSVVKGFTDNLMKQYENTVLNVRIRMPITSDSSPKNFINKITKYEYICSIPNSMTVLDELIPIIIDMTVKNIKGTINLVNPNLISHNEILEMYKEIVDNNFTWKNFTIEEQDKILLASRSNNCLDTTKLKLLYPNVKDIKTSVRECLEKMKKKSQ